MIKIIKQASYVESEQAAVFDPVENSRKRNNSSTRAESFLTSLFMISLICLIDTVRYGEASILFPEEKLGKICYFLK